MSVMGGVGMWATGMWQPVIGGWLDKERAAASLKGFQQEPLTLLQGRPLWTTL